VQRPGHDDGATDEGAHEPRQRRRPATHHPPGGDDPDGHDAIGELRRCGERHEHPAERRPRPPGPPGRHDHRGQCEGAGNDVDVRPEDPDADDERVEGPHHVDPAVQVGVEHGPQQGPDGEPRDHHEQLPDPHALAQRGAPDP